MDFSLSLFQFVKKVLAVSTQMLDIGKVEEGGSDDVGMGVSLGSGGRGVGGDSCIMVGVFVFVLNRLKVVRSEHVTEHEDFSRTKMSLLLMS